MTAVRIPRLLTRSYVNHLERILANHCASGSTYGWCGSSGHCDNGCQTAYEKCNAQANGLTARDALLSLAPVMRVVASTTALAATQAA